jgi:hypothetical protein
VQIEQCTHEEADRISVLYLLDVANAVHEKMVIRTCDTDVILSKLASISMAFEVWISFGVGSVIDILQHILL